MSTPITDQELQSIENRANAATEGPWEWARWYSGDPSRVFQGSHLGETLICLDNTYENCQADCVFIENARTDIPKLLAEIKRLKWFEEFTDRLGQHYRDIDDSCPDNEDG